KMVWHAVLSKPQKTVDDFTKINFPSGEEVHIPIINNQTNLTGIKADNLNIPRTWQYYDVFSSYLGEYNLGTAFKKILTEDEKT
ncbi:MAG: hypothetical protein O2897_04945, partial [bacterium]|nr:hypothetical protein [bacterium]